VQPLRSRNPATNTPLADYAQDSDPAVRARLESSDRAFAAWRRTPPTDRAAWLRRAAGVLRDQADPLALLMADEMGKPVGQGRAEVAKCAAACDYFAEHAPALLRAEPVPTEARRSFVAFEPLGPILAVMPWNFPLWQVIRCAAPALAAGNPVVLKHASNVTGCALALAEVFHGAGLPDALFAVLRLESARLPPVIAHPAIRAVTLTGSVPAGRTVAALAGAALKKTVLELGGSDPYVILADADLALAARVSAQSRLLNSGQSCIAAKRFVVVESVRAEFEDRLAAELAAAVVGDPRDPATTVGPLARTDLRDDLHAQVTRTIDAGAACVLGGHLPSGPGAFYPPTLLTGVRPGMPAFDEETFGPVAAVTVARDETEAIELANRSSFGLGAAVFTQDLERGEALATHALEAGNCFVNTLVRSDPRLPFGGIRDSGYGRELAAFGIREFANIKTVYVA
jgi:succinate-semialdehyde dehydrogenase/glutarate-semialdehyde dehydrogenase